MTDAELQKAYSEGMESGDQAEPRDSNPHPSHTALYAWWDAGWSQSLDELCGS